MTMMWHDEDDDMDMVGDGDHGAMMVMITM